MHAKLSVALLVLGTALELPGRVIIGTAGKSIHFHSSFEDVRTVPVLMGSLGHSPNVLCQFWTAREEFLVTKSDFVVLE